MPNQTTDYMFEHHGSLYIVHCANTAAHEHLVEHTNDEAQWMGRALVVEPRYASSLAEQLIDDGFSVS